MARGYLIGRTNVRPKEGRNGGSHREKRVLRVAATSRCLDGDIVVAMNPNSGNDKLEKTRSGFVECFPIGVQDNLWVGWFFVGRVNSGELGDFAIASALVEAFDIARLAGCKWRIDIDFKELDAAFKCDFTCAPTIGLIGGDECSDDDESGVCHEFCDFGDAPDVFGAVFMRKAEICVQAMAYVVAVEHVDLIAEIEEFAFEVSGQG